ncbi:hypothetical protein MHI27_30380 [Paenibacillus sp. FSL H8-0261]
MSKYDEAMKLLEEQVGNKDGLISLSTIALEPGGRWYRSKPGLGM